MHYLQMTGVKEIKNKNKNKKQQKRQTMITLLGIILILVAISLIIINSYNKSAISYNEKNENYLKKDVLNIPGFISKRFYILTLGILLFIGGIVNPFSINDAGNRQVVQTLNGKLWVKFKPGLYFSGFWSKVTTYPNNFTIQVSRKENASGDADLWVLSNIKDGTFSEGDNAELEHTVKWDLPSYDSLMIDLHVTYNNVENLMNTTLLSYQKKMASFSTQRMSSEAHYSGGKSQLDEYFKDQLENGQVILITTTKTRLLEDSTSETYIDVTPKTVNGEYERVESDIQKFGIVSTYTSMDNVHYTPEIDTKLKQKIKYAANKANSKQELIAAQQEKATAIVKGEKLIAETTAREEAKEKEAVIQARKERLVAQENVLRDEAKAKSTLALKRAEAEGDKLKVAAGLSPKERAEFEMKTRIAVARELAKANVPSIVVGGSDGSNGSNPMDAIGINFLMDINERLSKKK